MDIVQENIYTIKNQSGPIKQYFEFVGSILANPTNFFRSEANKLSLSECICFALVNAWLSTLIVFVWSSGTSIFFLQMLDKIFYMVDVEGVFSLEVAEIYSSFLTQAGVVILTPFLALFSLYATSVMYLFFLKLAVPRDARADCPNEISFRSLMRIFSYTSVATWFSILPFIGSFISTIAWLLLSFMAIREFFSISSRRTAAVIFAPYVIMLALLMMVITLLIVASVVWLASALSV